MTLYEIDSAIANFDFQIDEFTGELLNAEELDSLQMAREEKIENIALYIKELDAECDAIKNEMNSLRERLTAKENKHDSLMNYLKNFLNGQRFETPRCRIGYRKSQQVILSGDFEEWAKEYAPDLLTEKVSITPDKTAIKNALKDGRLLKGATLVDNQNLQIK